MWIRLKRGNDWGSIFLYDASIVHADGRQGGDSRIAWKPGILVTIRTSEGEKTLPVVFKEHRETVSDHGHEYATRSHIPGVELFAFGVLVWVPLDREGIEVLSC